MMSLYGMQERLVESMPLSWRKVPFGAWLLFLSFGILFSIVSSFYLGGSGTRIFLIVLGLFLLESQKGLVPFWLYVSRTINDNLGSLGLLLIYYLWIVVGCMRVGSFTSSFGMDVLFMWKYYLNEWFALFVGFFLLHHRQFRRWAVYVGAIFLVAHAFISLRYVSQTGGDIREAMGVTTVFGVSGFWETFAMGTILLIGYLLDEKQKWLKIVGICCLPFLFRAILFCGFATPLALFLIGLMVVGMSIVLLRVRNHRLGVFFKVTVAVAVVMIIVKGVSYIAADEDDLRTRNIQFRFQNMLANPEGGGYDPNNSRLDLMGVGWESFKKSPLLGAGGMYTFNPASGGHQAVVDYLGIFGLLGGGSYILFVLLCIRNTFQRFWLERTWANAATAGVAVMYFVGGVFNPNWYGPPTMVLFFYAFPFRRRNEPTSLYGGWPMVARGRA